MRRISSWDISWYEHVLIGLLVLITVAAVALLVTMIVYDSRSDGSQLSCNNPMPIQTILLLPIGDVLMPMPVTEWYCPK